MTVLTAVVILGGIKSIARVCEGLVPFMAIFYVLGCAILLVDERCATIPGDRRPDPVDRVHRPGGGRRVPRARA